MPELLRLEAITKTFPGVVANRDVTIHLDEGEVLGLLGENGAGKTTLMNVLYGLHRPDSGRILVQGDEVRIGSPREAIGLGVGMVHQHFMLVPNFTVAENVMLGLRGAREPLLDTQEVGRRIRELSDQYGLGISPDSVVESLSVGEQQKVEILKLLYRGARIFVLDEPTAVLTPEETNALFASLRNFTRSGHGVVFITHKLEELLGHCDRITVLRHGEVVGTVRASETSKTELAQMMVGRDMAILQPPVSVRDGEPLLDVVDVSLNDESGQRVLDGVTVQVRSGEVLGVAGVDGNGQLELGEIVTGSRRPRGGEVRIAGKPLEPHPRRFVERGGAVIPADRHRDGLVLELTVAENLVLRDFTASPFSRRGVLARRAITKHSERLVDDYDIRTSRTSSSVWSLSGGNQQKVVIAREFHRGPRVVVASQPTRGLDIGATEFVYRQLLELVEAGAAVLLISTDLQEILTLSHRIAVMHRGRVMGVVTAEEATPGTLGQMMAGVRSEELEHVATATHRT
ncbi:MAG: ABC transporter ATP-binding protein [Acidimicrobiia bacterium]|nr:ABC transporter ATP-binding protein [Acidimicrobiia bacterium]